MGAPTDFLRTADDLLRGEPAAPGVRGAWRHPTPALLMMFVVAFGMFYGSVMGTYGGLTGDRALQLLYSAVKVPFLIMTTFGLSLPSFFVVNALLGLRGDFARVVRGLMTTQAGLTLILTSLSPVTAFWYVSGSSYQPTILFNGVMFAVASLGAQWILRREYAPLIRKDQRHTWMLRTWILIYVFVGIQMAWVLRPFIGDPQRPVQFFREDSWSNAYEVVLGIVWQVLQGRAC